MDATRFVANVRLAWVHRGRFRDFLARLLLAYSSRVPARFRKAEHVITFRYPPPTGMVTLRIRDGSDYFIVGEVFEHNYYCLPLHRAPRTILDLGANVGYTAIWFGRLFPGARIACVEPVSENVRLLQRNLLENGVEARVMPFAVGIADGRAEMLIVSQHYGHHLATAEPELVASAGETREVEVRSMRTLMDELGWPEIDLLKMDIEGSERVLLTEESDWLWRINALCVEWHHDWAREAMTSIAEKYGFEKPRQLPGIWFLERRREEGP